MLAAKRGGQVVGKLVEVFLDMYSPRPLPGTARRAFARWNNTGYDVTCSCDLDFVGLPGLDGGDKPGQVCLGVVHVHPHRRMVAKLARSVKGISKHRSKCPLSTNPDRGITPAVGDATCRTRRAARRRDGRQSDWLAGGRDVVEAEPVLRLVVPMEDLRRQVEPVGPDNGSSVVIDTNLSKILGVVQGKKQ